MNSLLLHEVRVTFGIIETFFTTYNSTVNQVLCLPLQNLLLSLLLFILMNNTQQQIFDFFPDRYKGPKDIYIERVLVTSNAEEVIFLLLSAGMF